MASKRVITVCALGSLLLGARFAGAAASPAAGTAAGIDACSLLTAAEISQAIGMPVEAGVRRDEGLQATGAYSSACLWTVRRDTEAPADPAKPLGGKSFVILNAMRWPAGSNLARTYLENFREAAASGDIPAKPSPRSFGDEALWWGDGLAVRKGDVSFGVSVFLPGAKASRPAEFEEKLAPHILRRLDQRDAL